MNSTRRCAIGDTGRKEETMSKKQMIAELERRMRYFYEQYEDWTEIAKSNPDNVAAKIVAEYNKGKAVATEEAIKVISGQA